MVADNCLDLDGLIAIADRRLYAAKAAGRDRVVASEAIP
jgi:PleD family two-component response regulator